MNWLRPLIGLLAAGAAVWFGLTLLGSGGSQAAPSIFNQSSSCAECHDQVYAEWQGGQHATSWTGKAVRELSKEFKNQVCIDCHAPQPVFATGIGTRVLPRTLNRIDGVDCISCHALPAGGVAASIDRPDAPCSPTLMPELATAEHCVGCHNQHQTVEQWRGSRFAAEGTTCIDCHMPYRDGDPTKGRMHGMHGGSSIENLRAAVELRGAAENGAWVVEVENVGAGHSFPTDERSRSADVFWRPLGEAGAEPEPWRHLHRFRSPYRFEVDVAETLLAVHEIRSIPVESFEGDDPGAVYHDAAGARAVTPAEHGAIEVALFYKRSPFYIDLGDPELDDDATLVQRIELRP